MPAGEVLLTLLDAQFCVFAMYLAAIASDLEELDLEFNVSSSVGA